MRVLPNDRLALPPFDVAPAVRTLASECAPAPERAPWQRRLLPALMAWGLYDRDLWTPTDAGHVLVASEGAAAPWAIFWCLLRADGDLLLAALRGGARLDGWAAGRALRSLAGAADGWEAPALAGRASALEAEGAGRARAAAARTHFRPLQIIGMAAPSPGGGSLALTPAGEALRAAVTEGPFASADASSLLYLGASRAFLGARGVVVTRPASAGELRDALLEAPEGLRCDQGLPGAPLDALVAWLQGRLIAGGESAWVDEALASALARSDTADLGGRFELARGQSVGEVNLVWRRR